MSDGCHCPQCGHLMRIPNWEQHESFKNIFCVEEFCDGCESEWYITYNSKTGFLRLTEIARPILRKKWLTPPIKTAAK